MRGLENVPWLFDAFCALAERGGLSRWRDWLVAGARGRTLEVGCGTGRNLPRYGAELRPVAVEPDGRMLQRARPRARGALLVRASAEALPFRDGAFDTVVASLVFCSVPDAALGLAEARRVLGPRGRLRMLEHVRSTSRWRARLQDLVQPAWTWLAGGCHPNRRTEEEVERAGFVIEAEGRRSRGTMRRFSARRATPG
ncbi:MAG TPA: class I SAM-dependent methyltransferase [Anaeromyxobacteraceae bacterium]